jgi:signal peptidase
MWFVVPRELGGRTTYISVVGFSMQPTMYTGDLVVLHRRGEYATGDVVGYRAEGEEAIIIHRIVGGSAADGFITQGDNRETVDSWRPRPDEILGSQTLHVPKAGAALRWVGEPLNLGIVLAGIMTFPMFGKGGGSRRRRRGNKMAQDIADDIEGRGYGEGPVRMLGRGGIAANWVTSPAAIMGAFAFASVVAVVAAAAGAYAAFQPVEHSRTVERLRYEHTSAFDYAVHMAPATLYPEGIVGPVPGEDLVAAPARAGAARAEAPPESRPAQAIYTQLAQRIVVNFTYALESSRPIDGLKGTLSGLIEIRASDNGWRRTQEVIAPVALEAGRASGQFAMDLTPARNVIAAIEKETGSKARTYDLVFAPTVRIQGSAGGEQIDTVHARAFTFSLNDLQIIPASQLTASEERVLQAQVTQPARIGVLGASLDVAGVRRWSALVAVPALMLVGVLGAVLFLGLGRGTAGQIQARYGAMLVPVDATRANDTMRRVRVGAFRDLARLARRDDPAVIFHEYAEGWHRYVVEDGATVYEFVVADDEHTGVRDVLSQWRS